MLENPKASVTLWPALQGAEAHCSFGHRGVGAGGDGIAIGWALSTEPQCAASLTHCSHRAASVLPSTGGELGSDSRAFRLFSTMVHCLSPECVCLAIG